MGQPFEYINPSVACAAGHSVGLAIPLVSRGTISRFVVVQNPQTPGGSYSTDLVGFSYQLFNSVVACPVGADPTPAVGVIPALYAITPLFVVASTKSVYLATGGIPFDGVTNLNYDYACQDNYLGTGPADPSSRGRSIYLKISATADGSFPNKTFGVALCICDASSSS